VPLQGGLTEISFSASFLTSELKDFARGAGDKRVFIA